MALTYLEYINFLQRDGRLPALTQQQQDYIQRNLPTAKSPKYIMCLRSPLLRHKYPEAALKIESVQVCVTSDDCYLIIGGFLPISGNPYIHMGPFASMIEEHVRFSYTNEATIIASATSETGSEILSDVATNGSIEVFTEDISSVGSNSPSSLLSSQPRTPLTSSSPSSPMIAPLVACEDDYKVFNHKHRGPFGYATHRAKGGEHNFERRVYKRSRGAKYRKCNDSDV